VLASQRRRQVTDEPQQVALDLLGRPLASVRRRTLAYALDVLLFATVTGALILALSVLSIHLEDRSILPRLTDGAASDSTRTAASRDLLRLMLRRAPQLAPPDLAAAMAAGDLETLAEELGDDDFSVSLGPGRSRLSPTGTGWDLVVGTDLLLGRAAGFFSWGAFFVGWFTIWTRLGHGRTPAKRLLGLRIRRLDGKPLSWWDSFGRAGGYGASAATAMLGFLEAAWHPNRQAIHDRIAGTVVLRERRQEYDG